MNWLRILLLTLAIIASCPVQGTDLQVESNMPPVEVKLETLETKQEEVEARKESVATISPSGTSLISKVITVVPPYFHGSALETVSGTRSEAPAKLANYAKEHNIDIGLIVRSEFDRQLMLLTDLDSRLRRDATIRYNLAIRYGISRATSFSPHKPYLSVAIAAIDASGKALWKANDYTGGFGSLPTIDYDEFYNSPSNFKSTYEAAAKMVVELLLKKVGESSAPR